MRYASCRYEVFCGDSAPFSLHQAELPAPLHGAIAYRRIERAEDVCLFKPPRFGSPAEDEPPHSRRPTRAAAAAIGAAVREATTCYVVTNEDHNPTDLSYLQSAIALAAEIARQRRGVVVDRMADIGYTAELAAAQRGRLDLRDTIVIVEQDQGDGNVRLATRGMQKFASHDFVLDRLPAEHAELGSRLLYDNLCRYAALKHAIEPGQNLQYMRSDPSASLFFTPMKDGRLLVSDCVVGEKRALPGLRRFVARTLPAFQQQIAREAAACAANAPTIEGEIIEIIENLDEYVELMALIDAGRMTEAFSRFGLDYHSFGAVTDQWSRRLEDPRLAVEFTMKMEARAIA